MCIHGRMKAMARLLLGAALLSAQIIPATAADMAPRDKGPIAPPFNWTGVYLGADLGGAWSTIQAGSLGTNDASSVIGGVYAGYNWQFTPGWLIGIEGDASWADFAVPAGSGDVNWAGSLRGRIGWTPWAATMVYFTGGAAWGTVSIPGGDTLPATQTKTGWVIGGGVEWALWASNWSARAEYLNYSFTGVSLGAGLAGNLTINEIRAGVAYKF